MTELLPCPFCGSENITQKITQRFPDVFTVVIGCADCPGSPLEIGKTKEEAEYKARKLWNTRHYSPEVKHAVERMKPKTPYLGECLVPICPECMADVGKYSNFCRWCGQALYRESENETLSSTQGLY